MEQILKTEKTTSNNSMGAGLAASFLVYALL